jgi:uncharacterized protein (TIGR03083 family)
MSSNATAEAGLSGAITDEYLALADLLEASPSAVWDAPSLCEGWPTRHVVAHMTMAARYSPPMFLAELQAAGGDFTRLSNTVAERDAKLPAASLLADLRSEVLHAWRPPGGQPRDALTHCVIHQLDITEALGLDRRVPPPRIAAVLAAAADLNLANLFGVDLTGVELRANDLDWSFGTGEALSGPAQVLALVMFGRTVPKTRLTGPASPRFTR